MEVWKIFKFYVSFRGGNDFVDTGNPNTGQVPKVPSRIASVADGGRQMYSNSRRWGESWTTQAVHKKNRT